MDPITPSYGSEMVLDFCIVFFKVVRRIHVARICQHGVSATCNKASIEVGVAREGWHHYEYATCSGCRIALLSVML